MKSYERNEAEFLTTIEKWDLLELLSRSGCAPRILVAIEVQPRFTRTGFLEERGHWIRRVWDITLHKIPGVAGHRMMWSQLLFICRGSDIQAVENQFAEILHSYKSEELKSLCVFSVASGGIDAQLAEVERMFEGLGKERNFGDPARFQHWLLDGERFLRGVPHPRDS
jgi:hypothetical protein